MAIVFHVVAYGLLQFVFKDYLDIHFLHLYAVLFFLEVAIMLTFGRLQPLVEPWKFERKELVDMAPWRWAKPVAFTLLSLVVFVYLLFSPIGLVNGIGTTFVSLVMLLALVNIAYWWRGARSP